MALTFNQIYDLYRGINPSGLNVNQFSQKANQLLKTDAFAQGQRGTAASLAGKANYWIDEAIPDSWENATGEFGRATFDLFGANPQLGYDVGHSIPKTAATWLPAIFGGPVGLAITSGLSGLETYGETGSAGRGATSALLPYVGSKVGEWAGKASLGALSGLAARYPFLKSLGFEGGRDVAGVANAAQAGSMGIAEGAPVINRMAQTIPDRLVKYAAGQVGGIGAMEGAQYGTEAVAQGTFEPNVYGDMTLKDWVLQAGLGNLPFMAMDVKGLMSPAHVSSRPVQEGFAPEKVTPLNTDAIAGESAALEAEYLHNRASISLEKDSEMKKQKLQQLEDWYKSKGFNLKAKAAGRIIDFAPAPQTDKPSTALDKNAELAAAVGLPPEAPLWMVMKERAKRQEALEKVEVPPIESVLDANSVSSVLSMAEQLSSASKESLNLESVRQMAENLVEGNLAPPDEALQRAVVGTANEAKVKAQKGRVTSNQEELQTAFADFHRLAKTPEEQAEVKAVLDGVKNHSPKEGETKDLQTAILGKWRKWKQEDGKNLQALQDSFKNINLLPDTAGPSVRGESGRAARFKTREEAQALADTMNLESSDPNITTYEPRKIRGQFEVKPNYKTEELRKRAYAEQSERAKKVVERAVPELKPTDSVEQMGAKAVYDNFDEWYKQWVDPTVDDLVDASIAQGALSTEAARKVRRFFADKPKDLDRRKLAMAKTLWDLITPKAPKKPAKNAFAKEDRELNKLVAKEEAELGPEDQADVDAVAVDRELNGEMDPDEMQQIMESYSPEEGLKFAQLHAKAGGPFRFKLGDVFSTDAEGRVLVGPKVVGKGGLVLSQVFDSTVSSRVSKDEVALWKELAPGAFGPKGVDVNFLKKKLEEAEQVKTVEMPFTKHVDDAYAKRNALEHELDTLHPGWDNMTEEEIFEHTSKRTQEVFKAWIKEDEALATRYQTQDRQESVAATGRYGVDPHSNEVLRGERELSPGVKAVWSGDLGVNVPETPQQKRMAELRRIPRHRELQEWHQLTDAGIENEPLFQSQHYSGPEGANQLGFARGAIFEYQPGTKLPNGRVNESDKPVRVMEVWEVQSDWQSRRKTAEDSWRVVEGSNREHPWMVQEQQGPDDHWWTVDSYKDKANAERLRESKVKEQGPDSHPLLPHWEPLTYKAALDHALKNGADYIYLTDAESGMMTEGHDQAVQGNFGQTYRTEMMAKDKVAELESKGYRDVKYAPTSTEDGYFVTGSAPVSQEKGMRAAYDERGPNILKKLTGVKGERAEMGLHEKAKGNKQGHIHLEGGDLAEYPDANKRPYDVVNTETGEVRKVIGVDEAHRAADEMTATGSAVFGGKKGNTGLSFDLTSLRAERTAKGLTDFPLMGAQLTPRENAFLSQLSQIKAKHLSFERWLDGLDTKTIKELGGASGAKEMYDSLNVRKASPAFYHLPTMSAAEATLTDGAPYGFAGEVYYFNRLVSRVEGQGGGTEVLNKLLDYADEVGIPIINEPNATGQLDAKALPEWYRKKGFVQLDRALGDSRLVYWPGTKAALGMKSELIPSLANLFGRVARMSGESQEHIAAMMPLFGAIEKVLPRDGRSLGVLMNDVLMKNGYVHGAADNTTRTKARLLLAPWFGATGEAKARLSDVVSLMFHESGHVFEPFLKGTQADQALRDLISNGGQELEDAVSFIRDHLTDAKDSGAITELLAQRDPDELYANIVGLGWMLPKMSKETQRSLALLSPQPIKGVYQKILDYTHRFFSYIKAAVFGKKLPMTDGAKAILEVQKLLDRAQKEMKRAEQDLVDLGRLTDANENLWNDARTSQFTEDELVQPKFAQLKGQAKEQSKLGKFYRDWFSNLHHWASRNQEVAGPVSAMYDHGPRMTQLHNNSLAPLWSETSTDPNSGGVMMSGQKKKINKRLDQKSDSRANKLISQIMTWNQAKDKIKTTVDLDKLKNATDAEGQDLYKRLSLAPKDTRDAVIEGLADRHLSIKVIQDQWTTTNDHATKNHVAGYLSTVLPDLHMETPKIAAMLIEGKKNALNPLDPQAQLLGQQQLATVRSQIGDKAFTSSLELVTVGDASVQKLTKFFSDRAGFFSRMRFGEQLWTVRNNKGEALQAKIPVPDGQEDAWKESMIARYGPTVKFDKPVQSRKGTPKLEVPDEFEQILKEAQDKQIAILQAANVDPAVIERISHLTDVQADIKINELMAQNTVVPDSRTLAPGDLDMVAVHNAFMGYMARRTADMELRSRLQYEMADPRLRDVPEKVAHFYQALNQYKTPDSKFGRALAQGNMLYYIAGSIPTHITNAFQSWMTAMPELVARGLSPWKATQHITSAAKDVAAFTWKLAKNGVKRRLSLKEEAALWPDQVERLQLFRFVEEGNVGFGTFDEIRNNQVDAAADLTYIGKRGSSMKALESAKNGVKKLAELSLKAYATTEHFNVRTSFIAGLRLAKQKGMTQNEAYEFAKDFVRSSTYQGGRAGRPVAPFEGQHKLVGHLAYGLQTYNLGWLGQLVTNFQRWRSADSDPAVARAGRNAAMTMLGLQFAAAGALGMPFFGAATTLLEKTLGIDLRGRMYQQLSQLLDEDDQEGGGLADIAMKGGANALLANVGLPLDFGSRFAIGGVVGMNEYDGWQPNAVFGPTAGVVSNVLAGLKGAYDGDWPKAIKEFSPNFLKKAIDYSLHGAQILDSNGSPVQTSNSEEIGYALGFVPSRLSKLRQFQSYQRARNLEEGAKYSQSVEELAALALESPDQARVEFAKAYQQLGGVKTASELASDVATKAAAKSFPTDVRSSLPRGSQDYLMQVAKGVGLTVPYADQVKRMQFKNEIMRLLGVVPRPNRAMLQQASRADQLGDELSPFPTKRHEQQRFQPSGLF